MKKIILAVISLLILLGGCSSIGNQLSSEAPASQAATPEPTPEPTLEPTPEPTPEAKKEYTIGETVSMGDWEITVNGYSTPEKMEDEYGFQDYTPKEGEAALCVSLTVRNNGKTQTTFIPEYTFTKTIWPSLVYGDGYTYNAAHSAVGGPKDIIGESVAPLTSITGNIFFAVPLEVISGEKPVSFVLEGKEETLSFSLIP